MTSLTATAVSPVSVVDPRGLRVAATITTIVLAVVLLLSPHAVAAVLLAAQAIVFLIGATKGPAASPYGIFFRRFVRPRLGPPTHTEDQRPPQFAQAVGLVFAVVGLIGLLTGATIVADVAVSFALIAALLNASIGFCLGCEMYVLLTRARARATGA
jgi:hypothetical protein